MHVYGVTSARGLGAVRIEAVLIAVRLAGDLDAVALLREAVNERDDAGGAGEGVSPLLES